MSKVSSEVISGDELTRNRRDRSITWNIRRERLRERAVSGGTLTHIIYNNINTHTHYIIYNNIKTHTDYTVYNNVNVINLQMYNSILMQNLCKLNTNYSDADDMEYTI